MLLLISQLSKVVGVDRLIYFVEMAPTQHPFPVSNKLDKQKAQLLNVQSKLEKYHELSSAMGLILNNFDDRLKKLEHTILPVYNETEHLQKRQQRRHSH